MLKRSGLPVWHTLGFNPYIYMTFACPLSLGQESQCECVDVKTEAENPDFAQWQTALNAIMPAGIEVYRVEPVKMKADAIAYACYCIRYPADAAEKLCTVQLPRQRAGGEKEQARRQDGRDEGACPHSRALRRKGRA